MFNLTISPEFQKFLSTLIQASVLEAVQNATGHLKPSETVEYLDRKQAAALLGICLVTLNEWTKTGKVKGYRIGSRVRYKRHEIEKSLLTIKTR